jgi:RimJ/RimL family protein N-acetyltransferase
MENQQNPVFDPLPDCLESERLLLRCPRPGDGALVYAGVLETLSELRAWGASLPWARHEPSPQASETYCRESHAAYQARSGFAFLLFLKADGDFVGCCGLHQPDWGAAKLEVGYWCRKRYHGQGLMSEALRAVGAFAVDALGARRLEAMVDANNLASRRVCERAGYRLEGGSAGLPDGRPTHVRYLLVAAG